MLRLSGDDRLVALIRAGNEPAFEVIYDRYHRQLLSFCRHMLGRAEEAEDAVQQTFISAHADLKRSDRPIALRAWLFTIARNRCLSILRARRETATLEDVEPETDGLAAEVQRREDLRTMLGDIAHLPEDQCAALVLAELGDLDHDDIAAVVGCPKEKVKALVFQARSSLALSRQARETSCQEIREQIDSQSGTPRHGAPAARHAHEAAAGTGVSSVAASAAAGSVSATAHGRPAGGSSAAHSNRAAAHQNALAHGRGLKRGLLGTQSGHNRTSTSSHGQGQGVGRGGRGQGSTGSAKSNANSQGNGTSSSGNASHESHPNSNSNANPNAATPSDPGSTAPSPRGSSRGRTNGQH